MTVNQQIFNKFNDYNLKFPLNQPYNKPQISSINLLLNNNKIVNNINLIYPLIHTSLSLTNQVPTIIKAKKSVASFNLRKKSPIGLLTTLRRKNLFKFVNILNKFILPRLITHFDFTQNTYCLNSFNSPKTLPLSSYSSLKTTLDPFVIHPLHSCSYISLNNTSMFSLILPSYPLNIKDPSLISIGGYIQVNYKPSLSHIHTNFSNVFINSLYQFPVYLSEFV